MALVNDSTKEWFSETTTVTMPLLNMQRNTRDEWFRDVVDSRVEGVGFYPLICYVTMSTATTGPQKHGGLMYVSTAPFGQRRIVLQTAVVECRMLCQGEEVLVHLQEKNL